MSKSWKILIYTLLVLFPNVLTAQTNCAERLKFAKQLFESGQIEQIPSLLDSCLNKGFNKNEENQAYRLLLQTYLFDYNREKAKEVMLRFLKIYPEYSFSNNDPLEIKEIFDLFDISPNWAFGLYGGAIMSDVSSTQIFSVFNLNNVNSKYTQKFGYAAGLYVEKYIRKDFTASLGLNYKTIGYQNEEITSDNQAKLLFKESFSAISAPLNISYTFNLGKFSPFLYCGAEINYLLKARGDYTFSINSDNSENISVSGSEDILSARKSIGCSVMGGIGLRYKIPKGFLKLWIGYNYGIINPIDKNNRYKNFNNVFTYRHIDDDLTINYYSLAITYTRILYKIKSKQSYVAN